MTETFLSPFVDDDYSADRNIVKHYHEQMALYLGKKRNEDPKAIYEVLSKHIQPNQNGYKDRRMQVLVKNKYGDREVKVMTASNFFNEVRRQNCHLSPSMVAYKNTEEEQSVNAIGTEKFLSLRSHYKGLKQKASDEGDEWGKKAFHEIQNALKIFNNAQSGAMSSRGTPLVNKSGHTALTSACRALTSTANMCNEKLLVGNRFFNSYERTMENLLSLLSVTDIKRMDEVIKKLKMNYATIDQVMEMVKRCSRRYWRDVKQLGYIKEFLEQLRPVELTALLCNMDIEGLRVTNKEILYKFFDDFSHIPEVPEGAKAEDYTPPDNGDRYTLCVSKLLAKPSKVQLNFLNQYHLEMEHKWKDFIEVFFKCSIPPSGIYEIRDMIREVVQTSDTDSSIYTVDKVVEDYTDEKGQSLRLNGVLTYFIRMIAVHQHAQLSENMNVAKRYRNRLTMKNEYLFGGYVTTLMSKHYFATQLMVEGVLNKNVEMEIKGVHLRSSKVAHEIKDFAHKLMREILDCIYDKRQMDAADILFRAAELERAIIKDINEGQWGWLTRNTIKSDDVYTLPDQSVYQYHLLWEEVFSPKYGHAPPPPYSAMKVNLDLGNKGKVEEFCKDLEDRELANRLLDFFVRKEKKEISTFFVPADVLPRLGKLPDEVIKAADIRQIIKQNLKSVYAVLEACGLYIVNDKITRLISDEH